MENDWVAQRFFYEDFPETRVIAGQTITLPKKPVNQKSIPNFYKKKENQKFYPPDQEMVWTIHEKMTAVDSKGNPVYGFEDITEEERKFVEQQWYYRTYGYWFYNNGHLEYITGLHWFYLSYFKMRVTEMVENHFGDFMPKRGFSFPNFQDSDRDRFLFWDAVVRSRRCAGMFEITNRRDGKSYRALCTAYEYATRPENANSTAAIQSKNDKDAESLIEKLVASWREMPAYFKPLDNGYNRPKRGINFDTPNTFSKGQRKKQASLNSWIKPFASGAVQLDGQGIDFVYHDEAGKTMGVDVYERWKVVQETLVDNAYILGRGLVTTTIEEVSKENVQQVTKLWNGSDSTKTNSAGMTDTGLYQYFKPAYYGFRGDDGGDGDEIIQSFVDEYGYSNIEAAKKHLNSMSENLVGSDLWAFRRKYPFTINEALRAAAESSTFPTTRIYDQIDFNDVVSQGRIRQGRFIGSIAERNIRFTDDPDGPFLITWEPDKEEINKMKLTSHGPSPANDRVGLFGVDPFDHDDTIDNRRSDASIHGLFDFNPMEPIWSTGAFLEYLHRPPTASAFYNDAMKAFMFFGMKAIIENQKPGLIKTMKANGMQGYIFKTNRKDTTLSGANKMIDGLSTAGRMIREELINETVEYFSLFVGKITEKTQTELFGIGEEDIKDDMYGHFYFNRTLRQALKFDPKDWEKFDAIVSLMLARYALVYRKRKQRPENENKGISLDDVFGSYDISGRVSSHI